MQVNHSLIESTQNIQQDPMICVFGECGKETGDEMDA